MEPTRALLFVRPQPGMRVPVPADPGPDHVKARALSEDGELVPDNLYWRRRIADGDVERDESEEPSNN